VRTQAPITPPPSNVRSTADLAEAFHLAHAVATLYELKVLDLLVERPATADVLAKRYRLDRAVLQGVLEYLAARTDIVRKKGRAFVATRHYGSEARFLLGLYLGAFRPNAIRLGDILRNPRVGAQVVDRRRHARTFERAAGSQESPAATMIRQLALDRVLDLGCGPGDLLVQMGKGDGRFAGWGVEMNPQLCRIARARIRAARLTGRLRVIEGDSRRLPAVLPSTVVSQVTGVTACHVANEMFQSGSMMATSWLRGIRRTLPGRPVLINDYYGRLGTSTREEDRHTLLHDYAQLISGQGIPPFTLQDWNVIYIDAGYRLVHVLEDQATTQFIHVLV
jgi:SAM-dependent methyltransferase